MIVYEWDVERINSDGDVVDHDFFSTCPDHNLAHDERLALVRDEYRNGALFDRQWAYVDGGKLPATFDGGAKVPARIHAELAKARP